MPKAPKYKVRTTTKTNPLLKDETHTKAREEVLPVVESLKSAKENDRKWSSAIISQLVQDDTLRLTLLREGIVNALLDRLTDNNFEVKFDAVGSLDALILHEGQSLCKELYRKNVIKLLERVYNEGLLESTRDGQNKDNVKRKFAFSFLEAVYTVLNRICEECEEAAEAATKTVLLTKSASDLAKPKLYTVSQMLIIAQFIRTLTTDRPDAAKSLSEESSYDQFVKDIVDDNTGKDQESEAETTSLKLTIGGQLLLSKLIVEIVINVAESQVYDKVSPPPQLGKITQHAKLVFQKEVTTSDATNDTPSEDLLSSLRSISSIASYLDTYLEIYPETTPTDSDTMTDEQDPFEDEMDVDNNLPPLDSNILIDLFNTIPMILKQQLSVPVVPHALETINDIAWTMTMRIPQWSQWQTIAKQFLDFAVPRIEGMVSLGEDTASTFLGCIWATTKSIPGTFSLDEDDILLLEKLYENYPAELQAKIVGILGIAAQMEIIETNKHVTTFLLRALSSSAPLVVIEVMDAMMEIFADGEKEYDTPVFVNGDVLSLLKQAVPRLRKRVKSIDSRKESDLRERGDEVLTNFTDFLKYKETERK